MATASCKYKEKESKTYSQFLLSLNKNSCEPYVTCHGQSCFVDLHCDHYASWSADDWSRVQVCSDELQRHCERGSQSPPPLLNLTLSLSANSNPNYPLLSAKS